MTDISWKILNEESDIALILLDVVMEEDDSGLKLVKYIRDDLRNKLTRIILRTAVPGEEYEINDYKEKIYLSTTRLFTPYCKISPELPGSGKTPGCQQRN